MMEVKSHALQGVRRSDKMFSPEGGGLSSPLSTGLSLGVNGMDSTNATSPPPNSGYMSSITSMRTPLPNSTAGSYQTSPSTAGAAVNGGQTITTPPLVPVGDGDFMSLLPPGIISGNQAVFMSPSAELLPSVSSTEVGTLPATAQEMPFERQNEMFASRDSFQSLSRDIPAVTAILAGTGKAARDVDPVLSMATMPDSLQESKPDLNIGYNDGETQIVSDTQAGVDVMTPPLAGETQPIDNEGFDDMVVLQNDTLTASTAPLENGDQPASLFDEPLQIVDTPPLEPPSLDVTTSTPSGITELKVSINHEERDTDKDIGVEPLTNKLFSEEPEPPSIREGPNESLLHTEGPAVNGGQPSKEEDLDTSEPQVDLLHEGLSEVYDKANKLDESTSTKNGNAGNADFEKKEVVSEKDVKAIVGRKVVKRFGRMNYKGEVTDFDSENQWFKVVYEDGDQEDLELVEVKDILLLEDASSNASTAKSKRKREGGPRKQARKQNKSKGLSIGQSRGRPSKKASSMQTPKKSSKLKSSQKSKLESSETESLPMKVAERQLQSQATRGGKRKRNTYVEVDKETRSVGKAKKSGKATLSTTKESVRKSPAKKGNPRVIKNESAKTKTTKRQNLSQSPAIQKRDKRRTHDEEDKEDESSGKSKGKRRKVDVSEDEDALVGKTVEKDFDGTIYRGKVTKFDKKTMYYKVTYEDGDHEDLELEELKAVLV